MVNTRAELRESYLSTHSQSFMLCRGSGFLLFATLFCLGFLG